MLEVEMSRCSTERSCMYSTAVDSCASHVVTNSSTKGPRGRWKLMSDSSVPPAAYCSARQKAAVPSDR